MNVLQLTKRIVPIETPAGVAGVTLRTYCDASDITPWLALRDRAFAKQKLGVRAWSTDDFAQEFLTKPWWRPERMWLAETTVAAPLLPGGQNYSEPREQAGPRLVGTVTLAMRGDGPTARPVVHWLMVDPRYRRQGIGRLLMQTLEQTAYGLGHRQVWLETHAAWNAAARLYEQMGYEAAF